MADPRTTEILQDPLEIFLHNRPQIHGVGNSTLSAQVSGDFAEILPTGLNCATTRLLRGKRVGIPAPDIIESIVGFVSERNHMESWKAAYISASRILGRRGPDRRNSMGSANSAKYRLLRRNGHGAPVV